MRVNLRMYVLGVVQMKKGGNSITNRYKYSQPAAQHVSCCGGRRQEMLPARSCGEMLRIV